MVVVPGSVVEVSATPLVPVLLVLGSGSVVLEPPVDPPPVVPPSPATEGGSTLRATERDRRVSRAR